MEKGEAIVAVAGPIMNFILAIVFSLIYAAIYKFAPEFTTSQVGSIVWVMLSYMIIMNLGLGIFNLIPLPPLDRFKNTYKFFTI